MLKLSESRSLVAFFLACGLAVACSEDDGNEAETEAGDDDDDDDADDDDDDAESSGDDDDDDAETEGEDDTDGDTDGGGEYVPCVVPDDCSGGPVIDECSTAATDGAATLSGSLTGSGSPGASYSATGTLVISVLENVSATSCAGDEDLPLPVARTVIHCVDLSSGGYDYTVNGLPASAEGLFVAPYLDVNGDTDFSKETTIGPDTCDLVTIPANTGAVDEGQAVELDIDLNNNGALLGTLCGFPACE